MTNITEQEQRMREAEAECHRAQHGHLEASEQHAVAIRNLALGRAMALLTPEALACTNDKQRDAVATASTTIEAEAVVAGRHAEAVALIDYDHARRLLRIETDVYNAWFGKAQQ